VARYSHAKHCALGDAGPDKELNAAAESRVPTMSGLPSSVPLLRPNAGTLFVVRSSRSQFGIAGTPLRKSTFSEFETPDSILFF
jgi:hypothetical protein